MTTSFPVSQSRFAINENGFAIGGAARKYQRAKLNNDVLDTARAVLKVEGLAILEEGKQIWKKGMDLLLSIKSEPTVEKELDAIWSRKDSDEFAKEVAPKLGKAELAELEKDLSVSKAPSTREHLTREQRAEARAQVRDALKKI